MNDVNAASIDLVCVNLINESVLIEECNEGRQWGFTGKQVIHPKQVDIVQRTFMPSEAEVSKAEAIIKSYNLHSKSGIGAWELDGKMIDAPMVKWAVKVLERSKL